MTKREVIEIIRTKGKRGCTNLEKYLDIPDKPKKLMQGRKWLCQIIYWEDARGLAVYWLDKFSCGDFIEWSRLTKNSKDAIKQFLSKKSGAVPKDA